MSEAAAEAARTGGGKKAGLVGGTPPIILGALGVALVGAIWAGADASSSRGKIAAVTAELNTANADLAALRAEYDGVKAALAGAGLDASTPDGLNRSIAARQRDLTRLESALVAKSAAAMARDAQVAAAAGRLGRLESALGAVRAAEAEASTEFRNLSAQNRALSRRIAELGSSAVSWEAAAGARRSELDGLIAEVDASRAMIADAEMWRARGAELASAQNRLAREVVGLQNQLVSLTAAVAFRQKEVATASVAFSQAEASERVARVSALELQAEATRLEGSIAALRTEHASIARQVVNINNRFIPALAAVKAREEQLRHLSAQTAEAQEAHAQLVQANAELEGRMASANSRIDEITRAAGEASTLLAQLNAVLDTPMLQAAIAAR